MIMENKQVSLPANDFFKFDIRVGCITAVETLPKSNKLLKLNVDFGNVIGDRIILAGIAGSKQYGAIINGVWEDSCLVGQRVIAVLNLEPREMMGVVSHGMILAAHDDVGTIWLANAGPVSEGSEVG